MLKRKWEEKKDESIQEEYDLSPIRDYENQPSRKRQRIEDRKNWEEKDCLYPEKKRHCDAAAELVNGGFHLYVLSRGFKNPTVENNKMLKNDWTSLPVEYDPFTSYVDETKGQFFPGDKTAIMYVRQFFCMHHMLKNEELLLENHEFKWQEMVGYISNYIKRNSFCIVFPLWY